MEPLSKCNFVYGPNGSGKTTLSRLLSDPSEDIFKNCSVIWENNRKLRTFVYNRDFVEKVFNEKGRVKGVFTLGSEDKKLRDRIDELFAKIREERARQRQLTVTLEGEDGKGGKKAEMSAASKALKDACLKQTRKHEKDFEPALAGVRGNSAVFMSRFLDQRDTNTGTLSSFEDLKKRARSIFTSVLSLIDPLPSPVWKNLKSLEGDSIFSKPILGKGDVSIARLITKLKNSDWVADGVALLKKSHPDCPFCQQKVPGSLERELADFFDESFMTEKENLSNVVQAYDSQIEIAQATLSRLAGAPVNYHDASELDRLLRLFSARLSTTKLQMGKKLEAPSSAVDIDGVAPVLEEIEKIISAANEKISEHNRMVADSGKEKKKLIADFWRYLIDVELKEAAATYDRINSTVGKAVIALQKQIDKSIFDQTTFQTELESLEQKTTSTQPTVDRINKTLRSFNFTNFHLERADEVQTYQLIRQNGLPAHSSLSEGERTFITFLYFYHLAQANDSSTGVQDDRVVVLDDPISSLDSDILFIVSTLVRELAEKARIGIGPVKQVIVLTHNVYFHKEVTFVKVGGNLPMTAYWTCRKKQGLTDMHGPLHINPVKSSYQLLWLDVRKPTGHVETLPNTMRRIFDSYFKLLGGVDVHKKAGEFEGEDRIACNSLLSWANDGSHAVHDDVYMAPSDLPIDIYLDVFRRIFEKLDHEGHYRMMMGDDFKERETVVPPLSG